MGAQKFLLNEKRSLRKEISDSITLREETKVKFQSIRKTVLAKLEKEHQEIETNLKREL